MKNFIVYNSNGEILRTGSCPPRDFSLQAGEDEFVMQGTANDITQKVEFDGFDKKGQPINPRIVDKNPEEMERTKIPGRKAFSLEKQPANITNKQWQDVLNRLSKLETEE